jgi:Phosphotransferase enzyme family
MAFLLSSENVFDYLVEQRLCESKDRASAQVMAKEYKNFNLVVSLDSQRSFLVKQERYNAEGNTRGEFWYEWRVHELFQHFSELRNLFQHRSEILHFDPSRSILVLDYLKDYTDLSQFYSDSQTFPTAIASNLGTILATFHQRTYENQRYKDFLTDVAQPRPIELRIPRFLRGLDRIGPGVFSHICMDGLDFWRLYQRYESLHQAMVDVSETFTPCCLTHNDLNLKNILLDISGEPSSCNADSLDPSVRLIDWEFVNWGDPAYDLGMVLSNYLKLWLGSLVVSDAINIETALRLATIPLDRLQPSLAALVCAYLGQFPEILERRPDFLRQIIQFTGLILIKRIQGKLEQLSPFDNIGICTLQVAKTLLCKPEESISMVFGTVAMSDLSKLSPALALG